MTEYKVTVDGESNTKEKANSHITELRNNGEKQGLRNPAFESVDGTSAEVSYNAITEEAKINDGEDKSNKNQQHKREQNQRARDLCFPLHFVLEFIEDNFRDLYKTQKDVVVIILVAVLVGLYSAYFLAACIKNFKRAHDLFGITMFALFCFVYSMVKRFYGTRIYEYILEPIGNAIERGWVFLKCGFVTIVVILVVVWIGVDTAKDPKRLMSLVGLLVLLLLCFIFSKHRRQIQWRTVLWGLLLQFVFGLLILRTRPGFIVFDWLGERARIFLNFSDEGAQFVFGNPQYLNHFFAFKVLPVVIFFSAFITVIYYLGWMEVIIKKLAWIIQVAMGTSGAESLNAAGNIFIGQTEAPLLIKPFIKDMTLSELHAVMTGGFATIAGSVLGAYISFGVSPTHLLSASVMSAPAALAISKLIYPETEVSKTKDVDEIVLEKEDARNIIDALAKGASTAIALVANIAANLIAILAAKKFVNEVLIWLGMMVDLQGLTLEKICSYVLMPLAFVMGVEWSDAFEVAELLGIKTLINEFIAYERLGELIKNRATGKTTISVRSEIIATYALCGFSNIGSVGIQIGGIGALAPERRGDLASVAKRALFAGSVACFMTACIAGILYDEDALRATGTVATTVATMLNATTSKP